MHAKKACRKIGAFQCFELLYICSLLLCVFAFILHKDSAVFFYRNVTVQKANNILNMCKKKSDMLVTRSSRKPQGLVSGLGNLKPVSH